MTGFGRAEGVVAGILWVWELRAVNGKGLDIRLRLPGGYEKIEPAVRKLISKKMSRGNLQSVLSIDRQKASDLPALNEDVLGRVLSAIDAIESKSTRAPSTAADILSIRGVFESSDIDLSVAAQKKVHDALLQGLNKCLDQLNDNRKSEGAALAGLLLDQLQKIEQLTAQAEADGSRKSAAILDRISQQLSKIKSADTSIDPDRLHQEAAILATKADVREELDRLVAHIAGARDLIAKGSPVGRKLEFLAQEFNRECNTLCSKSNAVSLTAIGLELKVIIDQFREQILNVE